MTVFDPGQQLRDGVRAAGWDDTDLWLASMALGSNLGLGELNAITVGDRDPTRGQYQVLAAALNEELAAVGQEPPLRTWVDAPRRTTRPPPRPHGV